MKISATKAAALALAGLLFAGLRLSAEPAIFRLFPDSASRSRLLSPEPEEPSPFEGFRLELRFPDGSFLLNPSAGGPIVAARPSVRERKLGRLLLTGLVAGTAIGYSVHNSLIEGSLGLGNFHFTNEGFFGRNTYAGGVDKAAHLVDYDVAARLLATTYRRIGYSTGQSQWMGFATAFAAGLATEIGDGTTYFGFSYEDLVMDFLGAASALGLARTGWDDTIGFRQGSISQSQTPPCCAVNLSQGRDYSGEIYTADLKISGLARRLKIDPGPARFLLFSLTYGSNGYNHATPEIRQRLVGFSVGVHFSEIFRGLGIPEDTVWGEVLYAFFDSFWIPYTAVGYRYDLNHHDWFGPTAGKTPFRVSGAAR